MQNVVSRDGAPIVMLVRAFACADERWTRPTMSGSCHHHAFTGLSAKNKAGFHDGDNREASRTPKNARRNPFLGHMAKLPDCGGRAIDRVLLGRVRPN